MAPPWLAMSEEEAVAFFAELYGGADNIPGVDYEKRGPHNVKMLEHGHGCYLHVYGPMTTYSPNDLTRLVVLAHARCVRVAIMNFGRFSQMTIKVTKCQRSGAMRHPTLRDALVHLGIEETE